MSVIFLKEIVGNPVTDSQGKEFPFIPVGGDCGYMELDETKDADRIEELGKICGKFGIYKATPEQLAVKKTLPIWQTSAPHSPPRVLQTSNDQSQPRGSAAVGNHPPSAAQLAAAAEEHINDGQPRLVKAAMPRETGFPNQQPTGYQQHPAQAPVAQPPAPPTSEPAPVLGADFKPKVGSPRRKAVDKPADTAATT